MHWCSRYYPHTLRSYVVSCMCFPPMLICPRILEVFLLPGKLSPVAICRCLGRGGRDGWERGAVGGGRGKGPLGLRTILIETGDLLCVFALSGFVWLFVCLFVCWAIPKIWMEGEGAAEGRWKGAVLHTTTLGAKGPLIFSSSFFCEFVLSGAPMLGW